MVYSRENHIVVKNHDVYNSMDGFIAGLYDTEVSLMIIYGISLVYL